MWQWPLLIVVMCMVSACQGRVATLSQREPVFPPQSSETRDKGESHAPEEVLLKRKNISVVPKQPNRIHGSLYEPGHTRNHLFSDVPRAAPGSYLDVAVVLSRQTGKPGAPAAGAATAAGAAPAATAPAGAAPAAAGSSPPAPDASAKAGGPPKEDDLAQILPKQFPHLDGGAANPPIVRNLKMNVLRRLDNGDAIVMMTRTTQNDNETKSVEVKARVPAAALERTTPLATSDLVDVAIAEVNHDELITRSSSGWEDEYTLLMSGFSEAKSRLAQEVESQRLAVDKATKQLETKLEGFGKERNAVAKERERVAKEKSELDKKLGDLEKTVDDQKKTIESLQPPETKPGTAKDGAKK